MTKFQTLANKVYAANNRYLLKQSSFISPEKFLETENLDDYFYQASIKDQSTKDSMMIVLSNLMVSLESYKTTDCCLKLQDIINKLEKKPTNDGPGLRALRILNYYLSPQEERDFNILLDDLSYLSLYHETKKTLFFVSNIINHLSFSVDNVDLLEKKLAFSSNKTFSSFVCIMLSKAVQDDYVKSLAYLELAFEFCPDSKELANFYDSHFKSHPFFPKELLPRALNIGEKILSKLEEPIPHDFLYRLTNIALLNNDIDRSNELIKQYTKAFPEYKDTIKGFEKKLKRAGYRSDPHNKKTLAHDNSTPTIHLYDGCINPSSGGTPHEAITAGFKVLNERATQSTLLQPYIDLINHLTTGTYSTNRQRLKPLDIYFYPALTYTDIHAKDSGGHYYGHSHSILFPDKSSYDLPYSFPSTLAHEFHHAIDRVVYANQSLPYSQDTTKAKEPRFKAALEEFKKFHADNKQFQTSTQDIYRYYFTNILGNIFEYPKLYPDDESQIKEINVRITETLIRYAGKENPFNKGVTFQTADDVLKEIEKHCPTAVTLYKEALKEMEEYVAKLKKAHEKTPPIYAKESDVDDAIVAIRDKIQKASFQDLNIEISIFEPKKRQAIKRVIEQNIALLGGQVNAKTYQVYVEDHKIKVRAHSNVVADVTEAFKTVHMNVNPLLNEVAKELDIRLPLGKKKKSFVEMTAENVTTIKAGIKDTQQLFVDDWHRILEGKSHIKLDDIVSWDNIHTQEHIEQLQQQLTLLQSEIEKVKSTAEETYIDEDMLQQRHQERMRAIEEEKARIKERKSHDPPYPPPLDEKRPKKEVPFTTVDPRQSDINLLATSIEQGTVPGIKVFKTGENYLEVQRYSHEADGSNSLFFLPGIEFKPGNIARITAETVVQFNAQISEAYAHVRNYYLYDDQTLSSYAMNQMQSQSIFSLCFRDHHGNSIFNYIKDPQTLNAIIDTAQSYGYPTIIAMAQEALDIQIINNIISSYHDSNARDLAELAFGIVDYGLNETTIQLFTQPDHRGRILFDYLPQDAIADVADYAYKAYGSDALYQLANQYLHLNSSLSTGPHLQYGRPSALGQAIAVY